jgi:hypothetical protein
MRSLALRALLAALVMLALQRHHRAAASPSVQGDDSAFDLEFNEDDDSMLDHNQPKIRRSHFQYPVEFLSVAAGNSVSSAVSKDKLLCFENRDYDEPSFADLALCILGTIPKLAGHLSDITSCHSILGTRTVKIEVR